MAVRTLSFDDELSLEEATERLDEVQNEFETMRKKYTSFPHKYRNKMPQKDQTRLTDCIGVLLPLGTQRSVQDEVDTIGDVDQSVHYKSSGLTMKIMDMMASFSNTGTERLGSAGPYWQN